MSFINYTYKIERIDQLIRLKNTGEPEDLARKIKITERSVYRTKVLIACMLLFPLFIQAQVKDLGVFKSKTEDIPYCVNQYWYPYGFTLSDEEKDNQFHLYCRPNQKTKLIMVLNKDTLKMEVSNRDTIRFTILVGKKKDTAYMEIIGVYDIPDIISKEDKLYHLSRLWSEAKYNFVNLDKITFDWDSLYYAYISKVLATQNDYDYYRLLERFYASLGDGHTQVKYYSFYVFLDYVPVNIEFFNNKPYITTYTNNIGMDSSFVGAEIIEIANMPVNQYLEDSLYPFISASTRHILQRRVSLTYGLKTIPFVMKVKKQDGSMVDLTFQRNGEETRTNQDLNYGKVISYSMPERVETKWMNDSILYLAVNTFYPEEKVINALIESEKEISKAKGLIIDIRENGGGSTTVAWHLQSYLTQGNYFLTFGSQIRINDGVKRANGNWIEEYEDFLKDRAYRFEETDTVWIPETMPRFLMPAVVLIGNSTFSAAEDFLVNLYEVPNRPLFIGEPTGGSTGSPLVIGLMDDSWARICTRRICFPYSKKPFVNEGIQPDILVMPTYDDYMNDKDVVLEKAIEYLKTRK